MKKYISLVALLFALCLCGTPSWAQLDGSIRGVVKGPDGKPIAGATIQLHETSSGRKYTSKTNSKGEYLFSVVYQGTYKATLLVNGNPVDEKSSVRLAAGQEQVVDWNEHGATLSEEQKQIEVQRKENESKLR